MTSSDTTTGISGARLQSFALGPFETNCYVVTAPGHSGCWIIDPGFEPREVIETVRAKGLRPEAIILTHAHLDHIAGVADVLRSFPGTPILIHEAEERWLGDAELNLSAPFGLPVTAPGPDRVMREGDRMSLGGDTWRVLHTPGHSPGGITLVLDPAGIAIVGDTLFAGSIGRSDFPNADFETLAASIRTRLYTLPGSTRCYPGHGPPTTIDRERRSNPFVRA